MKDLTEALAAVVAKGKGTWIPSEEDHRIAQAIADRLTQVGSIGRPGSGFEGRISGVIPNGPSWGEGGLGPHEPVYTLDLGGEA